MPSRHKPSAIVLFIWTQLCINYAAGQYIHYNGPQTMALKTCNFSDSFRLHSGLSLQECVRDCHLRGLCQYAIYRQINGICGLTETEVDIEGLNDTHPICSYTKPSQWNTKALGECSTNRCSPFQICNPNDPTGAQRCSSSECPPAPLIANARRLPSANAISVGLKVAYICNHGYRPRGNPSITCLENGTWTSTDFKCAMTCPVPIPLDNSDIAFESIEQGDYGPYGPGSVLSIKCKEGYYNNGSTVIKSACQDDKHWNVTDIPCCRHGYNFSSHGLSCYKLYNDPRLDSWDEMVAFCKSESITSSLLTNTIHTIASYLELLRDIFETSNSTLDYIVVMRKKSTMTYALLYCIDNSEVQISKHKKRREKNVKKLIKNNHPNFNVTGKSYETLRNALNKTNTTSFQQHEEFRLDDVTTRLNFTPGYVSDSSSYQDLYEELQSKTIDTGTMTNMPYTELADFIRNNFPVVPHCAHLDHWSQGHPNNDGDCIIADPLSNFTLVDVSCNITESVPDVDVGFICWEERRRIQLT